MRLVPAGTQDERISPTAYLRMQHLYGAALEEMNMRVSVLRREMALKSRRSPIHHVQTRIKTYSSICEKLTRKGYDVSCENAGAHLYDIAGMRIVCPTVQDVYAVARMLRSLQGMYVVRERDYIHKPKENGYRSLHIVLNVPVCLIEGTRYVPGGGAGANPRDGRVGEHGARPLLQAGERMRAEGASGNAEIIPPHGGGGRAAVGPAKRGGAFLKNSQREHKT